MGQDGELSVHLLALLIGCYVGGGRGRSQTRARGSRTLHSDTTETLERLSVFHVYSCYSETSAAATTGDIKDSLNGKKKKKKIQSFNYSAFKRERVSLTALFQTAAVGLLH